MSHKPRKRSLSKTPTNDPTSTDRPSANIPIPNSPNADPSHGLSHLSLRICQCVQEKVFTTYEEVAEALVREELLVLTESGTPFPDITPPTKKVKRQELEDPIAQILKVKPKVEVDVSRHASTRDSAQEAYIKKLKRRVYDSLHVLKAMNIISRERSCSKSIKWEGLPSTTILDFERLSKEKEDMADIVKNKRERLMELLKRQVMRRNLRQRNTSTKTQSKSSAKDSSSQGDIQSVDKQSSPDVQCPLPFVVLTTSQKACLNFTLDKERTDVRINMNGHEYLMMDDETVLSSLEM